MCTPRLFINGFVQETCIRAREGLPLPPNRITFRLVRSILARAQTFYPVTVCHFMLMSNHLHLLYVVKDPSDVKSFMLYLKRELAHAINRLLGRSGVPVWSDDDSAPVVLDAQMAKQRIAYFLSNPQKADLVDRIDEYPNLSTWERLLKGDTFTIECTRIDRDQIPALPGRSLTQKELNAIADRMGSNDETVYRFTVEPNAWMQCFDETKDADPRMLNREIVEMVRESEQNFRTKRIADNKTVLGRHALIHQSMRTAHTPKKRLPKITCLSSLKEIRVAFIHWFRTEFAARVNGLLAPVCFLPGGLLRVWVNPREVPCANNPELIAFA